MGSHRASCAHRRATRKKPRSNFADFGLAMIGWKNGKVREIPA